MSKPASEAASIAVRARQLGNAVGLQQVRASEREQLRLAHREVLVHPRQKTSCPSLVRAVVDLFFSHASIGRDATADRYALSLSRGTRGAVTPGPTRLLHRRSGSGCRCLTWNRHAENSDLSVCSDVVACGATRRRRNRR